MYVALRLNARVIKSKIMFETQNILAYLQLLTKWLARTKGLAVKKDGKCSENAFFKSSLLNISTTKTTLITVCN